MIPAQVREWLQAQNYGTITSERGVGGGCINNGVRIETSSGETFFLKTNSSAPADMFSSEAAGLDALRVDGGPRVPNVHLVGSNFILLEDLAPAARKRDYWQDFGHRMATLHEKTSPRFGFDTGNYIGSTPQPNDWMEDGWEFFAEHRLLFQARLAWKNGYFDRDTVRRVEQLTGRLKELIPEQPASVLHGDLWSGNAIVDSEGSPAIIDPAAYFGWAEADLAMTALFGGFSSEFYHAYTEKRPLPSGYRERFPIYNLYHLINHLNLFGEGYSSQVISILNRFTP